MQRIQYAKTKSDVIAKADGTFVPREKRKRHEERGMRFHFYSHIKMPWLVVYQNRLNDYNFAANGIFLDDVIYIKVKIYEIIPEMSQEFFFVL